MAQKKPKRLYTRGLTEYEKKFKRLMTERLKPPAERFDWRCDRHGAWIEFTYQGRKYRFDQTIEKARAKGKQMHYAADCFAQLVLFVESLVRASEADIFPLGIILQALPAPVDLPPWCAGLGFNEMPESADEVKARYRQLVKAVHPDSNPAGSKQAFEAITAFYRQAMQYFEAEAESNV